LIFSIIQDSKGQWNLPGTFSADIDAVFLDPSVGSMIFKGGEFTIYGGSSDAILPLSAITNWPNTWPGITGAASFDGETIFLFSGSSYLTLDLNSKSITGGAIWEGLPANWNNQIDAAVQWQPGVMYLFHNQEFVSYDSNTQQYGEVSNLSSWGLPVNWNNRIDAAINIQNGSVYFFRGNQYVIYDQQAGIFSAPTVINEGSPVAGNIPPPGALRRQSNAIPSPGQNNSTGNNLATTVSQPANSNVDPRLERLGIGDTEEKVEEDENSIRPTGPFPDEYRDDYKAFTSQLMNITWGAATASSIRPLAAKNWIGTGVDIIYVDPLQVNKSKRAPKSALLITDSDEIAGNASEYIIPFGSKFESIGFSETTESEKLLETYGEFQSTFGGSVGGSVAVPNVASGSASASFSQMNRSSFGTTNIYTYKQAKNELYKISLEKTWTDNKTKQKYRQKLDENFRRLVEQLKVPSTMPDLSGSIEQKGDKIPSALNGIKSAYLSIVKYYGTHLTSSVTFGGRFISIYEISRSTYENARMTKAGFESSISATIKGVQIGANASFDYQSAATEGQKSSTLTARSYITGGNANNYEKWNSNIETAPAAIAFDLMPISDLLNSKFFPNDKDIDKKAAILLAVMKEHVVNRMKPGVKVNLSGDNFFKELKPLEYEYDVAILHMKCIKVSSGEAGSANEFYGNIKFSCNGKNKTALDIDEDDAWELTENASRTFAMRDPYIITLAENAQATLKLSGHMYEEDDTSADDDLGTDSQSVKLHEIKNKPKTVYLDFEDDGDKVEIAIKISRKLKIESY